MPEGILKVVLYELEMRAEAPADPEPEPEAPAVAVAAGVVGVVEDIWDVSVEEERSTTDLSRDKKQGGFYSCLWYCMARTHRVLPLMRADDTRI